MTNPQFNKVDLHCHSYYSDGSLSPQQLIDRANANGVDLIAITDHDCIDGVKTLLKQPSKLPLTLIPAVEISSSWENKDIHIVGLNVKLEDELFNHFLELQLRKREQRGLNLIEKFENRLKIKQVAEKLKEYAKGRILCRSHFAQLLVDEGLAVDFRRAFERFLAKGKIAAVKSDWPDVKHSIAAINAAGGLAIIAHPTRYKLSNSRLYELIEYFSNSGGKALEMAYPGIKPQQQRQLARVASEFGLSASKGSDFHHPHQVWADLGKVPALPVDITPIWNNLIINSEN